MAEDDLNESQQSDRLAGAVTRNGLPFRQTVAIMYDVAIANAACLVYELSKVLMACSLCQLNESTQVTMPYTLAVYMVTDFLGASASPAKIS